MMDPFDDSETLSAPIELAGPAWMRDPIVAVRVQGTREELDLPRRELITIGSGIACDIRIDDRYASTVHCMLEQTGEGFLIRDRRSKNGTWLNGNRIQIADAMPGALVRVGKTQLVFVSKRGRGRLTAYEQLRGRNPTFRAAVDTAIRAAATDVSVLVTGETGTGKELIARAVHEASRRSTGPFIAVNCGAIPRELIGSELFGHVAGAFTGATSDRDGLFVQADGGTIFLDELGELPLDQQPHLLRVLETRTVRRLGDSRERPVDVRLIAATNRAEGLRTDLYHRVAAVVVEMPPLRDRPGDIPILARSFIDEICGEGYGPQVGHSTLRGLVRHDWPGNVRELRQAVQRGLALCDGQRLALSDLLPARTDSPVPTSVAREVSAPRQIKRTRRSAPRPAALEPRPRENPTRLRTDAPELPPIDAHVRDLMMDALDQFGSIRRAAHALGMSKSTFADKARRLGIDTSLAG